MAATGEERLEFGRRLKALRGETRSLAQLADELRPYGLRVVAQVLSNWERGVNAPTDRRKVEILDNHLRGGGRLLEALGYGTEGADIDLRVAALEETLSGLAAEVSRIAAILDEVVRDPG